MSILPAMKPSRQQFAAGVTVVTLGALATVALASGDASTSNPSAAPAAQSAPEVRTQIVRETVHRRAKRSSSSSSGGSTSSGSRSVRASSSPSPSRSAAPATAAVAPVSSPDHQRRGRGTDDVGFDDHGGHGGDDDGEDDHGGGDNSGHGGGGHDD